MEIRTWKFICNKCEKIYFDITPIKEKFPACASKCECGEENYSEEFYFQYTFYYPDWDRTKNSESLKKIKSILNSAFHELRKLDVRIEGGYGDI